MSKPRRMRRARGMSARRGVTLIELIVAVTILMLGLLSIVGVSASISRSLGQARQETLAANAAQRTCVAAQMRLADDAVIA